MRLNHGHFLKITETAHRGGLFRTFNFNGGLRKRRTGYCLFRTPSPKGKQFLWFLKIDLLRFHRIYLLFDWSKLLFFEMCLLINLPNLCPNMNQFDAVDFSECHSEEVISFFWRSVYICRNICKLPACQPIGLLLGMEKLQEWGEPVKLKKYSFKSKKYNIVKRAREWTDFFQSCMSLQYFNLSTFWRTGKHRMISNDSSC